VSIKIYEIFVQFQILGLEIKLILIDSIDEKKLLMRVSADVDA